MAVHQNYAYGHVPTGTGYLWYGPEADANIKLLGDHSRVFRLDATHKLTEEGSGKPLISLFATTSLSIPLATSATKIARESHRGSQGNSATDWSRASCALLREKIINIYEVNYKKEGCGILVDDLLEIPQAALKILADYETIVLEPIDFEKYFHFETNFRKCCRPWTSWISGVE
jgi:hypothetical protein